MKRRSWTRRVLKWVGTVYCFVIAVTVVASFRWRIEWVNHKDGYLLQSAFGSVAVYWRVGTAPSNDAEPGRWRIAGPWDATWSQLWQWWLEYGLLPMTAAVPSDRLVRLPLWPLLLFGAIPTVLMWHRDRSIPPGRCKHCGYDLTGNVSGRCPECGATIKREGKSTDANG